MIIKKDGPIEQERISPHKEKLAEFLKDIESKNIKFYEVKTEAEKETTDKD